MKVVKPMQFRDLKSLFSFCFITYFLLFAFACDDPPPPVSKPDQTLISELDMRVTEPDLAIEADQALLDMLIEEVDAGPNEIAWIELLLLWMLCCWNLYGVLEHVTCRPN